MAPGEARARAILVAVCVAALAVILGTGGCMPRVQVERCRAFCVARGGALEDISDQSRVIGLHATECICAFPFPETDGGGR